MDRDSEDRLVALLDEVEAPISRPQIYARVSDEFVDEEDLAKALGRLVASGRLHRSLRSRVGAREEFVYSTKQPARIDTIAAAVAKVQAPAANEARAHEEEAMPKRKEPTLGVTRQKIADHMTAARGWMSPADIAHAVGEKVPTTSYHLKGLERDGLLQATGRNQARRYAVAGIEPLSSEPAPEKGGRAEPKRRTKKKTGKRAARAPRPAPARNLAELGAEPRPQLPAVARAPEVTDDPHCAIEDTGLFAINDGIGTIRLGRKGIEKVVAFLTLTQHVWRPA